MITGTAGFDWKRIAAVVGPALIIAACASAPDTPVETPAAAVRPETPAVQTSITGTSWQAVSILGKPASAATSSLRFDDTQVSGSAGCNNFQGDIELDGEKILFGALATTRKMCAPHVNGQETVYLEALSLTRSWMRNGEKLELLDESNAVLIQMKPR